MYRNYIIRLIFGRYLPNYKNILVIKTFPPLTSHVYPTGLDTFSFNEKYCNLPN